MSLLFGYNTRHNNTLHHINYIVNESRVILYRQCIYVLFAISPLYLQCVIYTFDIHYNDVIMGSMASQITSLTIVYSAVYSGADQRKHHSSASLAFVRGIHRGPVTSPHKWPVTRKMFPFDDVIIRNQTSAFSSGPPLFLR